MPKKTKKTTEEAAPMEVETTEAQELPAAVETMRTLVTCTEDHPVDAQSTESRGTYAAHGAAHSGVRRFAVEELLPALAMAPGAGDGVESIVFDVAGIKPSLANALRRIMLAEVPSMAIEKVWFTDNTSVIPDEMLAHRMGLLPIKVDPDDFEFLKGGKEYAAVDPQKDNIQNQGSAAAGAGTAGAEEEGAEAEAEGEDEGYSDTNTLVFHLDVRCVKERDPVSGEERLLHTSVYSGDFEWVPQGNQEEFYAGRAPRFVSDRILLAKLREGQHIACECYALKGVGKDHAKFSPVGTACYRLLPDVRVAGPVPAGRTAHELAALCPMGVIDVEDGAPVARRPRNCTLCRNCIRHELGFADTVALARVKNHYIFSIESVGAIPAHNIFVRALDVLDRKCEKILSALAKL